MNSFKELRKAIKKGTPLVWNDPEPIEGNNYNITYIEPLDIEIFNDENDELMPILIQYGGGSEAQVYLHEIQVK